MNTSTPFANLHQSSLALAVVVALCGTSALSASAAGGTAAFATVAHPTQMRPGDAVMGALPMAQPIQIVVGLKIRNRAALDALLASNAKNQAMGLPAHLMTPEQILATHSPTVQQAQAVANYLTRSGFRNVVIAPNRMLVSADGTAATARGAFMTTLAQIRTKDGRIAFATTDDVRIPVAMQDTIASVIGLQSVYVPHTFAKRPRNGGAHTLLVTGHNPVEFSSIYGGGTGVVPASAPDVTVGIVTQGSLTQSKTDLNTFTTNNSLSTVTTQTVNTNGTSTDTSGTTEWDIDSQDLLGMAGGKVKKMIFYNIPTLTNANLTADFNTAQAANVAAVVNVSIGECELGASGDGSNVTADNTFALADAQGQTFTISTGDSGADECGNSGTTPSWPANSQYVVAVAGTTLDASTTTWASEIVWSGSGGSPSTYEPMPSWQHTLGVAGTKRVVADVAFDADPNSGALVIVSGGIQQWGGTSLAAPIFAGFWARVLEADSTKGFAAPVIYLLPNAYFHDVTTGNNGGETAAIGYDFASGRGSIKLGDMFNIPPVANFTFTTVGFTANFTDTSTDSDGTIASHSWLFGDGNTSTAANPSHTYAAAGTYTVRETVKDNTGAPIARVHFVTVSAKQLLSNTGFETGTAAPWSMNAGLQQNNSSLAHSGNWYAAIGAGGTGLHYDHASQNVTIPSGNTSATLAFFLQITTADTGSIAHDKLTVQVFNTAGTLLATLATYSNLDATSGYVQHSLSMTPYIGQKVTIKFIGSNGATLQTTWNLDDVTVTAQ